jgi:hypothetical protein
MKLVHIRSYRRDEDSRTEIESVENKRGVAQKRFFSNEQQKKDLNPQKQIQSQFFSRERIIVTNMMICDNSELFLAMYVAKTSLTVKFVY